MDVKLTPSIFVFSQMWQQKKPLISWFQRDLFSLRPVFGAERFTMDVVYSMLLISIYF